MAKRDWIAVKEYTIPATGDKKYKAWNTWKSKVTGDWIEINTWHVFGPRPGIIRSGYRGGEGRQHKIVKLWHRGSQLPGSPAFKSLKDAKAWLNEYMATHKGIGIKD